MFGSSILVCPKLTNNTEKHLDSDLVWTINCTLPKQYPEADLKNRRLDAIWYNWYSKLSLGGTSGQFKLADD